MKSKFLFLLIISSTISFAQEALTVKEAISIALENNYQITLAEKETEIAENNSSIGNAGFLPELNASGSYSKSVTNTTQEYLDGRIVDRSGAKSDNLNASVNLNWTVFDGLEMFASLNQLKELEKIGELNYKIAIENNITDVITTYYNLVKEQHVLEVIERNIAISEERVRIANDELEVGSGSKFDLKQAQVDLNADRSAFLREERLVQQLKISLNNLMGRKVETPIEVIKNIEFNPSLEFDVLAESTRENNSQLLRAERNKSVSDAQINIYRAEFLPDINLNASYNFNKSSSEAGFIQSNKNYGFSYGVSASLNIFNGLNTNRKIENAKILLKESEIELKQIKNNVEAELLNTYQAYQNSISLVKLETENLSVAKDNVDIALEKLKLGTITPLEFREVQRRLLDAESRLSTANYEAKAAETELLRLSGQLLK